MIPLSIVGKEKVGLYLIPHGFQPPIIPSSTPCPYCKADMKVSGGPHAILRLVRGSSKTFGDVLPPGAKIYTCYPCKQQFCTVPQEDV